jgi:hypothetical protein
LRSMMKMTSQVETATTASAVGELERAPPGPCSRCGPLGCRRAVAAGIDRAPTGRSDFGHSLLGMSVIGGASDEQRLRKAFAVIWPTNNYEDDALMKTNKGRTRFRDAMHVDMGIRYSGTGFITVDTGILEAAPRIASEFNGFTLLSIADATDRSFEGVRRVRHGAELMVKPAPTSLPDWP